MRAARCNCRRALIVPTVAAACLGAVASARQCPPSRNSCYAPGQGPGCNDPNCCATICAVDSYCCEVEWDGICVTEAFELCGPPPSCPPSNHGCFTTGGPGCIDDGCCGAVCAIDPACCDSAWDGDCIQTAFDVCDVPALACPGSNHNCFTVGMPGCNDLDCCIQICEADILCCAVDWDSMCVELAVELCADCTSECSNGCFMAHSGAGCNTPACCASVCSLKPECCQVAWDELCAGFAGERCCLGDVNADSTVDGADLGLLLSNWSEDCATDFNDDATTDGADLGLMLAHWGPCGPA